MCPIFDHELKNEKGELIKGQSFHKNIELAKVALMQKDTLLVSIKERYFRPKKDIKFIYTFTYQLTQLLETSVSLEDSLSMLIKQNKKPYLNYVMTDILQNIREGIAFSESLSQHPKIFDSLYITMIQAGELSDSLEDSLKRLSELIYNKHIFKKTLVSVLVYPGIVLALSLLSIIFVFSFLVPSMQDFYMEYGEQGSMDILFFISRCFSNIEVYIALLVFLTISLIALRAKVFRKQMENIFLKIPLLSTWMIEYQLINFSYLFYRLMGKSVPIDEAFKLSIRAFFLPRLKEDMLAVQENLIVGKCLSDSLSKLSWLGDSFKRMIKVGEESQRLCQILEKMTYQKRETLEQSIKKSMALLTPILLIVMGVFVGSIIFMVLVPLSKMSMEINF